MQTDDEVVRREDFEEYEKARLENREPELLEWKKQSIETYYDKLKEVWG